MDSPPRYKSGFAPAGTGTKPEMSRLEGNDHNNVPESFDTSKLCERRLGIYLSAVFGITGNDVERGHY